MLPFDQAQQRLCELRYETTRLLDLEDLPFKRNEVDREGRLDCIQNKVGVILVRVPGGDSRFFRVPPQKQEDFHDLAQLIEEIDRCTRMLFNIKVYDPHNMAELIEAGIRIGQLTTAVFATAGHTIQSQMRVVKEGPKGLLADPRIFKQAEEEVQRLLRNSKVSFTVATKRVALEITAKEGASVSGKTLGRHLSHLKPGKQA